MSKTTVSQTISDPVESANRTRDISLGNPGSHYLFLPVLVDSRKDLDGVE
jgi:hypothetical protein